MGDILRGIYDVPRDARGRRIVATTTTVDVRVEIAEPLSITVAAPPATGEPSDEAVSDASVEAESAGGSYDPAEYTVTQVLEYAAANPEAIPAIVAAEKAGKARKMILALV